MAADFVNTFQQLSPSLEEGRKRTPNRQPLRYVHFHAQARYQTKRWRPKIDEVDLI